MTVSNIAADVQVPNGMATLGNLVNVAQGVQNYQTNAIQQQRLGINLQSEAQANQERQNVVRAMQSGDPDLKADPTGVIDQAKSLAKLQQLAPQTWQMYAQNINQNNSQATAVNNQLLNLGQDRLNDLAKVSGSLAASGTKESDISDQLGQYAKANPQVSGAVNQVLAQIKAANGDPTKISAIMQHVATRTGTLADQFSAFQGNPELVNQGPQAQPTIMQPRFTGKAPGTAVGETVPMGVAPSYHLNAFGVPTYLQGRMPNSTGAAPQGTPPPPPPATTAGGAKPPQQLPPMPAFPNMIQAQNAKDAQARWGAAQSRDVDPASGYNATSQVYQNLSQLLKDNPNLGPGSAGLNMLAGRIGTYTGHAVDPNSAYQETAGYLDRLAAQNFAATGAATNFAQEKQANSTGNPQEMGPTAINEKLRFGASVNEAAHAYTQATQAFVNRNGQNAYANPQMFEAAWSQNADPLVFRLMAAQKNGDDADFSATQARIKAMPTATQSAIHQHYLNLKNYLLQGNLPPNG